MGIVFIVAVLVCLVAGVQSLREEAKSGEATTRLGNSLFFAIISVISGLVALITVCVAAFS